MIYKAEIAGTVEIRGFEKVTSKKGNEYLLVRFECEKDVSGESIEIIDRNVDNASKYKKGVKGKMSIWIKKTGKFINVEIDCFEPETQLQGNDIEASTNDVPF